MSSEDVGGVNMFDAMNDMCDDRASGLAGLFFAGLIASGDEL